MPTKDSEIAKILRFKLCGETVKAELTVRDWDSLFDKQVFHIIDLQTYFLSQ